MKLAIIPKVLLAFLALVSTAFVLSSCSTTKGFGEDLETLGRGISRASDDVAD